MSWATGPWVGYDSESTGIQPLTDRLVTACVAYRSETDSGWTRDWIADALAALRVLWRIGQLHPDLAALPLEELHERQVTAHAEWATHLQEYLRSSGKELGAVVDTAWPIRRVVVEVVQ